MKNQSRTFVQAMFLALTTCATTLAFAQVPDAVKPPAGTTEAMKLKGAGMLTYECKAKDAAFEWTFAGPDAALMDASGKTVGKYYGGPTWESTDGSKITGKQVGIAPAAAGNIPYQLVETTPAMGKGAMEGVTHIQRINTQGGVAPKDPCAQGNVGAKTKVAYSADYVFYKK
ncbi:MAG: DUF3455 domain-containing protein [Usitatibacter sp.]